MFFNRMGGGGGLVFHKHMLLVIFILSFANAFSLDWSKILSFGLELSFTNNKILKCIKMKAFGDDKIMFNSLPNDTILV